MTARLVPACSGEPGAQRARGMVDPGHSVAVRFGREPALRSADPPPSVGGDGLGSRDDQVHKANCSDNPIVPTPTRDRSDRWPAIGVNRLQDDRQAYSVRVTGTSVEAAPDL